MLRNESTERQNQIVGRIFSALGMKFPEADDAIDEMLAEWREALANLDMDAITARVEYWKSQGRTCPADEFAGPVLMGADYAKGESKTGGVEISPDGTVRPMTPAEVVEAAKKLYGESDQTFEEAYDHLKLNKRWGPLEGRK